MKSRREVWVVEGEMHTGAFIYRKNAAKYVRDLREMGVTEPLRVVRYVPAKPAGRARTGKPKRRTT